MFFLAGKNEEGQFLWFMDVHGRYTYWHWFIMYITHIFKKKSYTGLPIVRRNKPNFLSQSWKLGPKADPRCLQLAVSSQDLLAQNKNLAKVSPPKKTRHPLFRGVYTWANSWVRYIGISLFSDIHMGFPKLWGLHVYSKLLLSFSGGLVNGFGHTLTHQEHHNAVVSKIKTSKFYDVL